MQFTQKVIWWLLVCLLGTILATSLDANKFPGVDPTGNKECSKALNDILVNGLKRNQKVVLSGTYLISSPLCISGAVDAQRAIIISDNCDGVYLGDENTPLLYDISLGEIRSKDMNYKFSGVTLRSSIARKIQFTMISGYQVGIDFSPIYKSREKRGSTGENRIWGGTIQRCEIGVLMRYKGKGTATHDPNNRGWMEGNTIHASIFGCDVGVKQEKNALATFTHLLGVIDCLAGKIGSRDSTAMDIVSEIEYGILANLYFLRSGKYRLYNASTHKIHQNPNPKDVFDTDQRTPENLIENADFYYMASNAEAKYKLAPHTVNGITVQRAVNGSIHLRNTTHDSDPYLQIQLRQPATGFAGKKITIRAEGKAIALNRGGQLIVIQLFYYDKLGKLVHLSSGNYCFQSSYSYTFNVPKTADHKKGMFVRVLNPKPGGAEIGLELSSVLAWEGANATVPTYVRPRIFYGAGKPADMYWRKGDIVYNCLDNIHTDTIGVRCIRSGTPGEWVVIR